MGNVLAYAIQFASSLPSLISAGKDVIGLVTQHAAELKKMQAENRDPTPEEWAAQNKRIADLQKELHAE